MEIGKTNVEIRSEAVIMQYNYSSQGYGLAKPFEKRLSGILRQDEFMIVLRLTLGCVQNLRV